MTQSRQSQVSLSDTPYYHCISRCVRRAYLCGEDKYTEKSFEHRRQWVVERMIVAPWYAPDRDLSYIKNDDMIDFLDFNIGKRVNARIAFNYFR
ncbi:hypothetical protein MT391_13580 [Vibrio sp. 1-Bac 57]